MMRRSLLLRKLLLQQNLKSFLGEEPLLLLISISTFENQEKNHSSRCELKGRGERPLKRDHMNVHSYKKRPEKYHRDERSLNITTHVSMIF